ncbi:hypothetical protein CUMW_162900 [Citrus unshiu]|uniref:Thaumatin-like protein n=1 Tax=Citrus unshiu TaxID=55188 RepID=A0A2H5PS95_CITUN|nr:hypothetical protein CUMW_162900 [Citrus unshiu]
MELLGLSFLDIQSSKELAIVKVNFLTKCGDCNGVLECQASGNPPYTAAEFISGSMDFFDISLLEGFNVPMAISGCNREIKCAADINGPCPRDLKAPGGCKNPLYGF